MGRPPKEPTCPANPAPQGEQQQQEPSSDGQSQYKEPWSGSKAKPLLHVKLLGRVDHSHLVEIQKQADGKFTDYEVLVSDESISASLQPSDLQDLTAAIKAQTKALEEYTKATANLTIHIGLLIQAMAEDQDDDGDGPNLRTLG